MAVEDDRLEGTALHYADVIVIVVYFVFVLAVGVWSSRRSKRDSLGGYFLASRNMNFLPIGASLFASNIGSGHFIGLAGSGAASGIGVSVFELNAVFVLMLLGWIFVPTYTAAGVFTMPEYLRKRFGGQRIRVYLSILALLLYIFTKISADLFAGATFIQQSLKWDLYVAIIILLAIAALFTITGGLTAVIWTDTLQTVIMIIGAFALMIISFSEVGGHNEILYRFGQAIPNSTLFGNSTCGTPPDYYMHLMRDPVKSDLPWPGVIFGLTISSVWYWCSDQVIVQRTLASKNIEHAKGGCLVAGYLKLLPMYLLVFPGMAARILWPNVVGCATGDECFAECGSRAGCTNVAYPRLVLQLMPHGARGMMLAVMMAALMSSLTSIFNSSSTIFTIDIWRRIRKHAGETELLIVGRLFVVVLVVISILWIPIIQEAQGSRLFDYIQSITSYLAPPVCAVYVLGILWERINEKGAFWGLMVGLLVGMIRFVWEFSATAPSCGEKETRDATYLAMVASVHYLHFGIILFVIVFIVTVAVSLMTKPIDSKHLHRLTFWTRFSTQEREDISVNEEMEMQEKAGEPPSNEQPEQPELPQWKKLAYFVCGVSTKQEESQPDHSKTILSIHETPKYSKILNANAILLMAIAVFIWGFYA